MFHSIPKAISKRMAYLEQIDARDRIDGTPRSERLRQIPSQTGKFLALMAAMAPEGDFLEIGTSAGYSSLWLILACMRRGVKLTTYELLPAKVQLARETFEIAGVEEHVRLKQGDARHELTKYWQVGFCFLDAEKEIYQSFFDLVIPRLTPGGLFLADNVISHQKDLQPFLDNALADERVDSFIVPIGKGLLLCRRG
jgi:caffeoyl-CoA O-methyltransferase